MIEPLLLTTARVSTFDGGRQLTAASGFFFERDERLFFVTSRHVMIDKPSHHFPDRVEIELHTDADNLTRSAVLSVLLYRDGQSIWRQGSDAGGEIDVAVIELERAACRPRWHCAASRRRICSVRCGRSKSVPRCSSWVSRSGSMTGCTTCPWSAMR